MPRALSDPERVLQRLDWTVIRRLDGLLQGNYRTLFRGSGMEMAELREYQLTDDVRAIDWNVTARLQTPWVRLFLEDRDITAWFLLDLSPSVDLGGLRAAGAPAQKRDILVDFTGVLARLLTRHGNRVGAMVFTGADLHVIPAKAGRLHVLELIHRLRDFPAASRAPRTDLSELLASAMRVMGRRSLVFLVSDFLSVPGWDRQLAMVAARHETVAVRLADPMEGELPDIGPLVLEDAETGEQLLVDTHDRRFRRRFAELTRQRREELQSGLARAGVDLLPLSTDGDLARDLVRFAESRARRRSTRLPRGLPRALADGGARP
ncbi:MAG TPA: DUF58 domain-containing protein [Spirochaetia bacterium]|nr:DUF58 domain-containing protein [Spirochaetia bacterium]